MKIILGVMVFLLAGAAFIQGNDSPGDQKGSGIIFLASQDLGKMREFYISEVGCELWLDQGSCLIFRYGNLLLGFCQGNDPDLGGTITFFYPEKTGVDRMYEKFKDRAQSPPRENSKYRIYHFYTQDPEGRAVEFQCFLHPLDWEF